MSYYRRWPTFMDFNLTGSNCISPSKIIPLAIKVVFLSLVHDNVRSQSQTTVINIKPKVIIQPGFSPVKKAFLSLIIEIQPEYFATLAHGLKVANLHSNNNSVSIYRKVPN